MARITIIGSGTVGSITGKSFAGKGHNVSFRDICERVVSNLRTEGYRALDLSEPGDEPVDFIFICVPTPTLKGVADLSALKSALTHVGHLLQTQDTYAVITVRSTVPVGTLKEVCVPLLEQESGKRAGIDFGLCSNPEYLRGHAAFQDFQQPRLVLIGSDDTTAARLLSDLYRDFTNEIEIVTPQAAEMHKYLHNLYNASKISFFNEQRIVCNEFGINAGQIFPLVVKSSEASWNPNYGIADTGPFSGSCLPKDLEAYINFVRRKGVSVPLLAAVQEVNEWISSGRQKCITPSSRKGLVQRILDAISR